MTAFSLSIIVFSDSNIYHFAQSFLCIHPGCMQIDLCYMTAIAKQGPKENSYLFRACVFQFLIISELVNVVIV